MQNINCNLTIDKEKSLMILLGLNKDGLNIDYSGDIDFTPLITLLTEMIDQGIPIILIQGTNTDITEKEHLIVETLKSIIESYNLSIVTEDGNSLEIPESINVDDLSDLPF